MLLCVFSGSLKVKKQELIMAQLLQIQIDEHLQKNAMSVLNRNGISIDDFVRRILNRLSEDNSFIYDIDIPNELTANTLKKSEKGEDVYQAKNADDLFNQLGI
ncbi:MAG: type II toxin-antitoxin system RelB/DinJ family antitoxin [Neisseriaceae bacterium]|nr:type II toxin-antitoxin system RelB/DinJ family antitoxin [Neisseriaceae bacterium]